MEYKFTNEMAGFLMDSTTIHSYTHDDWMGFYVTVGKRNTKLNFHFTLILYTDKSSPTITYNVVYLVLGSVHWKFPHKLLLCCSELVQPEWKIQLAVTAICMGTTTLHKNAISKLVMLSLH